MQTTISEGQGLLELGREGRRCRCAHDTHIACGMGAGEAGYRDMWTSWLLKEKPPPHQLAPGEAAWYVLLIPSPTLAARGG